jgi:hypothetical protein
VARAARPQPHAGGVLRGRPRGAAPTWAQQVGGPNTPAVGGTSAAVLDLQPGHYLVLCGVPADNGQPHLRLGMMKSFTVVSAGAAGVVPARATGAAVRATPASPARPRARAPPPSAAPSAPPTPR